MAPASVSDQPHVQRHVREHVETIATHEQRFLAERTHMERFGDAVGAFAGSLPFVASHLCLFAAWILINTLRIAGVPQFDPFPFSLLGAAVAIESLMLASFILMRQTRTGRRAAERDHLILQMLLLSEREMTASLSIQRQLATRLGLEHVAGDKDSEALSQPTSIDSVAQSIKDTLIVD